MKAPVIVLIGFLLLMPIKTFANDSTLDAKELYIACTMADFEHVNFCNGFMQAVNDYGVANGIVCTTSATTRTDLSDLYQLLAPQVFAREVSDGTTGFNVALAIFSIQFPCS